MNSSFPKRNERQSKNQGCNDNAKYGYHLLKKSASYVCTLHTHIYISQKLPSKTPSMNLALAWSAHFF